MYNRDLYKTNRAFWVKYLEVAIGSLDGKEDRDAFIDTLENLEFPEE